MRVPFVNQMAQSGRLDHARVEKSGDFPVSAEEPCGDIFIPIVENTAFCFGETDRSGSVC